MELVAKVVRIPLPDDVAREFAPFDYADVFEAHTATADSRPASEWLRCGFASASSPVRELAVAVHRHVLRLDLVSGPSDFIGWTVTKQEPDDFRLEASGPLIHGRLVARRIDPHVVRLCTFVKFKALPAAPVIWTLVGPIHRLMAPRLMKGAAMQSSATHPKPVLDQGRQ